MSVLFTWWWLALPMLILPLWWHRQRRQQDSAQSLATARFLPASDPRLQSVWRWRQILLLLLRLLMLLCLLALIAGIFYRGRGNTIFVSRLANKDWVQQQVAAIKQQDGQSWAKAATVEFCTDPHCAIATDDILRWLAEHQYEWKRGSRWLVLADENATSMSATEPQFQHFLDLRIEPVVEASAGPQAIASTQTVVVLIKSARFAEWQAWFKVFEQSLSGRFHFDLRENLDKNAKASVGLVIWESPLAPAAELQAPLWWVSEKSAFPERNESTQQTDSMQELGLKAVDTKQGKLWLRTEKTDWPLHELSQAKRLFETWRSVQAQRERFPAQHLQLPAQAGVDGASIARLAEQRANLDTYWIWALIALFCIERMVNHGRRP